MNTTTQTRPISLVVIDDHPIVRAGVTLLLQSEPDIDLACTTDTGLDGIEAVSNFTPDVILLDLQLPDISGLEVAERLLRKKPKLKILIITSLTNYLYPSRLFAAGVSGYLVKTDPIEDWANAIRLVYAGECYISPNITKYVVPSPRNAMTEKVFNKLSDREVEMVMLRIQGYSNQDIGERMNVSLKTIHNYRSRIFEKLKIENDVQLMLLALEHGLVKMQQPHEDE